MEQEAGESFQFQSSNSNLAHFRSAPQFLLAASRIEPEVQVRSSLANGCPDRHLRSHSSLSWGKAKTSLHRTVNRFIIGFLGEIALPVSHPLPHRNETPSQSRRIQRK